MLSLPQAKVKITVSLTMVILGVLQYEIPIIIANLILGQLILFIYSVPFSQFIQKLKPLLLFLVLSFIFFPLLEGIDGLIKAFIYSGRLLFVSQMLAFIFYQTSIFTFLQTLSSYRIPSIFIELIAFTLRFIDVFIVEIKNMLLSLKGRGFQTGSWFNPKKYLILAKLLGSMLLRSFHRSERIYLGMLSKGYSGQTIKYENMHASYKEWLKVSTWVIVMLATNISLHLWGL